VRKDFGAACLFVGLWLSGCIAPQPAEHPSAAAQEARADEAGVPAGSGVTIIGPIEFVDGKRLVHTGRPFEIGPGCHVVRTDRKYIASTSAVTVWYDMPAVDFVLPTREGYNYYVERKILQPTGENSPVSFVAYEREPSGKVVRTFYPTRDPAEIEACNPNAPAP
jgi:hypothetical protein